MRLRYARCALTCAIVAARSAAVTRRSIAKLARRPAIAALRIAEACRSERAQARHNSPGNSGGLLMRNPLKTGIDIAASQARLFNEGRSFSPIRGNS